MIFLKKYLKDIIIAIIIGGSLSYIIYLLHGGILYGDLYNQGIDFLEYYRSNISIFGASYNYNWSIALGDNMYSLAVYYLMSPFNILLILLGKLRMEVALPIFISIKFIFLIYFAALYFSKVTCDKFKWYGAIFYSASYYILNYGSIQIMWLDTFVFLPLVLLGIENIIKKEGSKLYIISLFLLIVTDYYLAALLVPHIAIYAIIRFAIINNGFKKIGLFIWDMIKKSLVGVLLSSFVLLPAAVVMLSSAKEVGVVESFGTSIKNIYSMLTDNYIGALYQSSNTYLTLIGVPVLISFILFTKNRRYRLYSIHILILVLGLCIEKVNYILNFTYKPVGGEFRYNLFLNIYVAMYIYLFIREIRKNQKMVKSFALLSILNLLIILFIKELNFGLKLINIVIICSYLFFIIVIRKRMKFLTILLSIFLLFEVSQQYLTAINNNSNIPKETRQQYSDVINYIKDKYGEDERIEIRGTQMSRNIYLANSANGVSSYHSLINGNYKEVSNVFSNTVRDNVRVEFKGRNIIAQYVGTSYYVSSYNYCPYYNSELIDEAYDFYIFEVKNIPFKFFNKDSIIKGEVPASMLEKDILLYSNLLINEEGEKIELTEELTNNYSIYTIEEEETFIEETGEYYVVSNKEDNIEYIPFKVNGSHIGEDSNFPSVYKEYLEENELYIGKLNYGDVLTINKEYVGLVKLICIKDRYIEDSIKRMNNLEINNLEKDKKGLKATFMAKEEGYVLLPIVYDKYWNIKMDEEKIEPIIVNGGFMAIPVKEGSHNLNMTYNFYYKNIGFMISIFTLVMIILFNLDYIKSLIAKWRWNVEKD